MIKRISPLCVMTIVLGSVTTGAGATTSTKVCVLNGGQEVPANASAAAGCGRFEIDTAANVIRYHIAFSGLSAAETAAHIHGPAGPGVNAGVKFSLGTGNPKVGSWNYPEADEAALLAGDMYVNVHSAALPGGEIRGQIVDMVAVLDGAQTTPPSGSGGSGFGLFNIDTCADTLDYYILFGGLGSAESNAHIHGFALHAASAGVLHPLGLGALKTGTYNYNNADEARILDGQTYVNIHSNTFPAGEIRGQITGNVAPLDGGQENPPNASAGAGTAFVAIDRSADVLSYHLSHQGMSGGATAAHLHGFAPSGVNAGVIHSIGTANPAVGTFAYAAADEGNILGGLTYFNVHTAAIPGGEIRGQDLFALPPCRGDLDCDGIIGFSDLLLVLSRWGVCFGCPQDIDGSGDVGFPDLLSVLSAWGPCP